MRDVTVKVDTSRELGPIRRIWRSLGYDELNWTYTQIGRDIFSQMKQLHDGPYWIRTHNAFTSGNGISEPAWGSTNCYTEDGSGKPRYDFGINDRIYDIYLENNCKPMIELNFMPHDLSSHPETGLRESWRYPPKDYDRWRELNQRFADHLLSRYGKAEVRTWYLSTWNEADINYFKWKPDEDLTDPEQRKARDEELFKVHDYCTDGIWSVDEKLRVGGPDLAFDYEFLDRFLAHCHDGTNYATGKPGSRLDFISLHCKGTRMDPKSRTVLNPDYDDVARRRFLKYNSVIARYDRFKDLPLIGNEWDIDVGTVLGIHDSPDWQFRNTSYFPTFVIKQMKDLHDLISEEGVNVELVMQWTFYFHGRRCFEGHRAIFDPLGIRKPLFNAFEMLSRLGSTRLAVETDDEEEDVAPGETVGNEKRRPKDEADAAAMGQWDRVQPRPQVDGFAARDGDQVHVLVWNQVYDQYATGERAVAVSVSGLEDWESATVAHYQISDRFSNAHTVWQGLGCPDWPDKRQIRFMKEREGLEKVQPDRCEVVENGTVEVRLRLPMHGVSMLVLKRG